MASKLGLNRSKLFVHPGRTRALMKTRYGTANDLLAEWEKREGASAALSKSPDRSTLYNWIRDGFPHQSKIATQEKILSLCALLDCDPLSIFDFDRNGFFSKFAVIRKALQLGAGRLGAWQALMGLYQPDEVWPSDALAEAYWGHNWFSHEFDNRHEYQSNDYAVLPIRFKHVNPSLPRCVHIAYRRWDLRDVDTMWRYYGTVIAFEGSIDLYNEGGLHLKMAQKDATVVPFRTFFGGRCVQFRIASLHDFDDVEIDFPNNDMSIVGFNW